LATCLSKRKKSPKHSKGKGKVFKPEGGATRWGGEGGAGFEGRRKGEAREPLRAPEKNSNGTWAGPEKEKEEGFTEGKESEKETPSFACFHFQKKRNSNVIQARGERGEERIFQNSLGEGRSPVARGLQGGEKEGRRIVDGPEGKRTTGGDEEKLGQEGGEKGL